ncbi:FIG007317: Chromosome segregation protein SMC-like, partial [hydrothermal vent metagenome]
QDAERSSLPTDSLIHLLSFSHATAKHYLTASYGNVVQVASADALRQTRRGLTAEGMGAGGYSMFRCDLPEGELVFGVAARERALKAKQEELASLNEQWQQANDQMQQASNMLDNVKKIQPLDYADAITDMLEIHRELQKLENLLAQLDLSEHKDLENKLTELREQEQQLRQQQGSLKEGKGELQEKIRKINKRCETLADEQEKTQQVAEDCEKNLLAIASEWPECDADARLSRAEKDAAELSDDTADIAINHRKEIKSDLHKSERKMDEAIQKHNQHCLPGDAIIYHHFNGDYDAALFRAICGLQRDLDRVFNRLKNNILVEKYDNLRQLKESFNNAFVTHFCHTIHQAISDGKRQIERLNKELQHHRFGDDRERFRFDSDWIPEFRDYARFFEEII